MPPDAYTPIAVDIRPVRYQRRMPSRDLNGYRPIPEET